MRSVRLAGLLMAVAAISPLQAQLLYVGNAGDGSISTYTIDPDFGYLTELVPRIGAPGSPTAIAVHPSGKFLFTTNFNNSKVVNPSLAGYLIDPTTGTLKFFGALAYAPGTSPLDAAIDAAGKFLFIANAGPGTISVYSIDPNTAVPTAIAGSPFNSVAGLYKISLHPNGKFAYAVAAGTGQVAAYTIGASGALTPIAGSPFSGRPNAFGMAMDPAGKFLYVGERQDHAVVTYAINQTTGALVQSASLNPIGPGVTGITIDPGGRFLYTANSGNSSVTVFALGPNGISGAGNTLPSVLGASTPVFDPSGKFLYTLGPQSNIVGGFTVDAKTGATKAMKQPTYATGSLPQCAATVLLSPPVVEPISVDRVVNQYSNVLAGMPFSGIAQGARIGIYGKNIGPGIQVDAATPGIPALPANLGGVSVSIQSGDVTTQALLISVVNNYVSALVPSSAPLGDATITVSYDGQISAAVPISIVAATAGIRTFNPAGIGQAYAYNAPAGTTVPAAAAMQTPNTINQAAFPGQLIIVQATGLGASTGDETQPNDNPQLDIPAEVIVGTKSTPSLANVRAQGADYILFQLPANTPLGCYVPLALRVGGTISNVASIAVSASGGSCGDDAGLTAYDIDAARQSSRINTGLLLFSHTDFGPYGVNEHVSGIFERYSFNSLLQAFSPGYNGSGIRSGFAMPPTGTCSVLSGAPAAAQPFTTLVDSTPTQALNAGPALNLSAPSGSAQLQYPNYGFTPDTSKGSVFTPGDYSIDNGPFGGISMGEFRAVLSIPPMLNWTNQVLLTAADRTQDLTFTWSGGIADKEIALIIGLSGNSQATGGFLCAEKVAAGTFTVPAWVLSTLPQSGTFFSGTIPLPNGLLALGSMPVSNSGRFSAAGLDFGVISYEQVLVNLAPFQ